MIGGTFLNNIYGMSSFSIFVFTHFSIILPKQCNNDVITITKREIKQIITPHRLF